MPRATATATARAPKSATGRARTRTRTRTRARDARRARDGDARRGTDAAAATRRGTDARRVTSARATGRDANARRTCEVHDLSTALTPYDEAWAWQRGFLERALERGDDANDAAILLQHPPTVTLGAGSTVDNLKFNVDRPPTGFEVRRCERGGEATYHGPGQLVLYPILNLARAPHEADLHWYMRALESVALEAMIELGLDAAKCGRVDGLTGAWCDGHKVAAVGVRARRWVSYHGVALNVCPDLSHFANIIPCGIGDKPVGSVSQLLRGDVGLVSSASEATPLVPRESADADDVALMLDARDAFLSAFARVFDLDLEITPTKPSF
jgi:lipoyl(octanoyl) transferase